MFRRRKTPEPPPAAATDEPALPNRLSPRSPSEAIKPTAAPPPPVKPERERGGMVGAISGLMTLSVVLGLGAMIAFAAFKREVQKSGPLQAEKVVVVPSRSGTGEIAEILRREGVIDNAAMFELAARLTSKAALRHGEYVFKPGTSISGTIDTLTSGRQIQHAITFPEGLTSEQIVGRLKENEILSGEIAEIPTEGSLLPDTYKFERGATRQQIVNLMRAKQREVLNAIWARRSAELPVKTPAELVTLASIVEKETGRADERPRVAGVFINRLNKRMRLQSDPTIVYGLVGGRGTLGRGIQRSEIDRPTPYNTYVIEGLPPGPIANPGRAALEAVVNPSRSKDLYFVADGTGGHAFAESLDNHQRNVTRWRQVERARQQSQPADPAGVDKADPVASEAQPSQAPTPPGARPPGRSSLADPAASTAFAHGGTAPEATGPRARGFDASEGTRLDPLRNRSWDLSTPKTVPVLRNP